MLGEAISLIKILAKGKASIDLLRERNALDVILPRFVSDLQGAITRKSI